MSRKINDGQSSRYCGLWGIYISAWMTFNYAFTSYKLRVQWCKGLLFCPFFHALPIYLCHYIQQPIAKEFLHPSVLLCSGVLVTIGCWLDSCFTKRGQNLKWFRKIRGIVSQCLFPGSDYGEKMLCPSSVNITSNLIRGPTDIENWNAIKRIQTTRSVQ